MTANLANLLEMSKRSVVRAYVKTNCGYQVDPQLIKEKQMLRDIHDCRRNVQRCNRLKKASYCEVTSYTEDEMSGSYDYSKWFYKEGQ